MRFTTYDNIAEQLDRTTQWINVKYKEVFSVKVKYSTYYQIIKRYNPTIQEHEFYIAFMSNKDKDNRKCRIDELGRCKFSIAEIWNDFCPDVKTDTNVKLDYVESIGDADIFKLSR